jgi:hypothetical protein
LGRQQVPQSRGETRAFFGLVEDVKTSTIVDEVERSAGNLVDQEIASDEVTVDSGRGDLRLGPRDRIGTPRDDAQNPRGR